MKAGKEHRVPLTATTIELLSSLPRERDNNLVFIGPVTRRGLSNVAMNKFMKKRMKLGGLATVHGFAAVEPRLHEVARSLQMSKLAVIAKIALPSASPDIIAGMRLSLTVALILAVVCEILAGLDGLGHWVLLSARSFRSADLFAGVILLSITGYTTSLAMALFENRLLKWRWAGH